MFAGTHIPDCVARFSMIMGGRPVEAAAQPSAGSTEGDLQERPQAENSADLAWREFIAEGAEGQRREQGRIRSWDAAGQDPTGGSRGGGAGLSLHPPGLAVRESGSSPADSKFTIPIPGYGNDDSGSGSGSSWGTEALSTSPKTEEAREPET